jgi:hypothetical protein
MTFPLVSSSAFIFDTENREAAFPPSILFFFVILAGMELILFYEGRVSICRAGGVL